MTDINELKRLALAATSGPWIVGRAGSASKNSSFIIDEYFVRRLGDDVAIAADIVDPMCDGGAPSIANAEFIAAANPQVMLELIERLERAEASFKDQPTEDMIIAGFEAVSEFQDTDEYKEMAGCQRSAKSARICWEAMIAAIKL